MKLGPVTPLEERSTVTSKKIDDDVTSILKSWSVKLIFSLTITFYLIKTGNRTKKSLTHLSYYCFE